MSAAPSNLEMEWLDLRQLTQYAAVSERTLRAWIHDPVNPLPAFQVGSKLLIRKRDFDGYIERHPVRPPQDLNNVVEEILSGMGKS